MATTKKIRFICDSSWKSNFLSSHCLFSISLGNHLQESENLEAILEKINDKFARCTIMVADTLQRYGLYHNSENESAGYTLAKKAGEKWIANARKYINNMTIPVRIKTWDDYIGIDDFFAIRDEIKELYARDREFFESVQITLFRFTKKNKNTSVKASLNFLLEECAALRVIALEGYDYEIYPSKRIPCMDYIYKKYVKNDHPNTILPVSLEIRSRKSLHFSTRHAALL